MFFRVRRQRFYSLLFEWRNLQLDWKAIFLLVQKANHYPAE